MVRDYLYLTLWYEPTVEEGEKRLRKQPIFDVAFLGPRTRKQGIHTLCRLGWKKSFQGDARIDEEHAHVGDFSLGDAAQAALHGGPFLLDADEVAFRMLLGLADQKLTIPKADFYIDRSLTSELLRPINGACHMLPEEQGLERKIACFHTQA